MSPAVLPQNIGCPSPKRPNLPFGTAGRPVVDGKFLRVNGERFWIKAVTYGTFSPNSKGEPFPEIERVRDDFALMTNAGINAVRLYTPPSDRIADAAADSGLMLIPDICWGSRTCELDYPEWRRAIYAYAREHVARLADHPAMLLYSIGNEIPPLLVRWHGREKVERHVRSLYEIVKTEAPHALVTYANHPPSEYLNLGFIDVVSFNVYLDREKDFRKYLARLQSIAGERPLFISELGLDSDEHGEMAQAEFLAGHLRAVFEKGLCGAAVYAWTDEWSIFDEKIEGWSFGLTRHDRSPKPALQPVREIFSRDVYAFRKTWPRVSVVVCSYNGGQTLPETLESLDRLNYPNCEVIVIDDGSTDDTSLIARRHNCRCFRVPNGGLSRARNLGIENATGEIVAFIDSDAYADPDWLFHIVSVMQEQGAGAAGGPNLAVPNDSFTSHCIDHAPGNPTHVLLADETAEHVPGCNMAFRKSALAEIGNFDPTHWAAGDDVDVCWKLLIHNYKIAFAPGAVVWHHRRPTVKAFLKQQKGYGFAEAFLQRRYPCRFNAHGNLVWHGSIYDGMHIALRREGLPSLFAPKIYHGQFCSEPFQSIYQPFLTWWFQVFTTAEWQATAMCVALAGAGLAATRNVTAAICTGVLTALMLSITVASALSAGVRAVRSKKWTGENRLRGLLLVSMLHILQPLSRARGRVVGTWLARKQPNLFPATKRLYGNLWTREQWLTHMQVHLKTAGWVARPSDDWQETDLEITGPGPCSATLTSVYEDDVAHATHYVRYRVTARRKPVPLLIGVALLAVLVTGVVLQPALAPLTLPILAYLYILWRARRNMIRAISQLAMECGKPFGMTPALDDF